MKWRGLPFQGDMVRATRAGLKTETRRVIKQQPPDECSINYTLRRRVPIEHHWEAWWGPLFKGRPEGHLCGSHTVKCPYGVPGDGLYMREAFATHGLSIEDARLKAEDALGGTLWPVSYRADCADEYEESIHKWRPSIHMPRWASRQGLILTDVAVERVQDIDEAGAIAEGVPDSFPAMINGEPGTYHTFDKRHGFAVLWDGINKSRGYGWEANPWVWRLRYELTDELPPPLETK